MIDKPGKTDIVAATVAHNGDLSGLRTRIAAILSSKEVVLDGWDYINQECAWLLADAVIAELGLDKEFGCPVAGHHLCRCSHRHITKWESNDDD
jgi:hypothetical protein